MSALVKSWLVITLMMLMAGGLGLSAKGENAVPITVVNYSRLPVHATAVTLDEAELAGKLGLAEGAPLQVRRKDGSPVPLSRGIENSRRVIRLYVSLAPESRLDLVAEPAARWTEALGGSVAQADPSGAAAVLANGILKMALTAKGWDLAFAGPGEIQIKKDQKSQDRNALITNGSLDFWIDTQNRGRIMNSNPRDFGLAHYADARIVDCKAATSAEGRPTLTVRRKMDGVASAMTVTETFELIPGLPILACRVRWQNDGDAPLWVAYVSSGDGIKGRWAKPLMAVPLIERKKSPLLGDLNGAETRPSWLPQLCRISMESPATGCGVGMSTLLPMPNKVGTGSMIWGCGASGFQCNFIDPVQGQFPFQVQPHGALENGFAFLATQAGASVYRQTVELWTALQKGKIPQLDPPCTVFIGGAPQCAQTVTEMKDGLALLASDGSVRRAALKLDFNKSFQLRTGIELAAPREVVEISARPMISGKPAVTLLRATAPGLATIDLKPLLRWKDEVPFVLEIRTPGQSSIKMLSIAETLPTAPEPLSPIPDASFTDIATMFRWKPVPMVVDYDLEWSRAADFTSSTKIRVTDSRDTLWYLPTDAQLPSPGEWFWRVRGVKGEVVGAWSQPRRFTVNNEHSTRPLKRPLTARQPLFTLEASKVTDFTNFHPDVPADIAPYVGIIAEGFEGKGLTVTDFARGLDRLPHSIMLRSHWVGLADIEWLFQSVPNFIGIQGGEHLSDLYSDGKDGAMRYAHRLTRLCAKYGMLYQEADGTYKDDKWQDLMDRQGDFVRQYGRYLVLSQKNNIIRRQFYSQSAALGLWLGGLTHQHGAWEDGGFYWQNAGFGELGQCAGERSGVLKTMPRIFWDLVFVMGISRGCGMYSLDGQTLMVGPKEIERQVAGLPRAAIWDTTGKTTDVFKRFVVPLIRGTVRHGLIPTREQVLRNVRLAVYNDMKGRGDLKAWPYYVEFGPLYAATYGFRKMGAIDGQLWEFFPNTGRYFYIPVLIQGNEPLGPEIKNLSVSQLQDPARVKQIFDAVYPKWYEGDALACRVGDTLTVLNSRENEDVTESYAVPLECGKIREISGKIVPHAYLVGKIEGEGRRLWLQANTEYPDRDTTLKFSCTSKPEWSVEPAGVAKAASWDETSKTLELRLSHRQGAVEVTLK